MNADLDWSPYTTRFTDADVGATISDKRGDSIRTYYRYATDSLETWYNRFNVRITDYLLAYCSYERDIKAQKNIESIVGIVIEKPCWGVGVELKDTSADVSITFLVTLNGIGGFNIQ
jgi:LPS-assembly protein